MVAVLWIAGAIMAVIVGYVLITLAWRALTRWLDPRADEKKLPNPITGRGEGE